MRRIASATMMILTNVVALWQSALGLLQVFGFKYSGHARFVLTGSLDNPGPYGSLQTFVGSGDIRFWRV